MNKATRMLVMGGMAVVAGAVFSAGPAAAASASPAPSAPKAAAQNTKDWGHDRSRIVGFFSNPWSCHRVGNVGEWRNRWDDHTCFRVPFGFNRGKWALRVSWDRHGWGNHNWNNNRPGFPHHNGGGFPHNNDGPRWPAKH